MATNPRKAAADIIYNVTKKGSSLNNETDKYRASASELDSRFVLEITGGVFRNLEFIDYAIALASDVKFNKISPFVLCVLRSGAYQILFMDKVPQSAAVDESVKIIKRSSNRALAGFVNAVLRKIAQNGKSIELPTDKIENMSIKYSCPKWIVQIFVDRFGDEAPWLLEAMNQKPQTIIRTNTLKTTPKQLLNKLQSEGWQCKEYHSNVLCDFDELIEASKAGEVKSSEAFNSGFFYIQDSAASYTAKILNPSAGDTVIDMCAAPGGKTTHLSQIMQNTGKIFAFDIYQNKLDKIEQNAKRLGCTNIITALGDGCEFNAEFQNTADKILVDSPCSGLGLLRRKPDIKYLRKPDDINALAEVSLRILKNAAKYLKSGGRMVFSTCTLTYEENEGVLQKFLQSHDEFHLVKIDCNIENDGYITLLCHQNNCDGFFISLLEKE